MRLLRLKKVYPCGLVLKDLTVTSPISIAKFFQVDILAQLQTSVMSSGLLSFYCGRREVGRFILGARRVSASISGIVIQPKVKEALIASSCRVMYMINPLPLSLVNLLLYRLRMRAANQ